MDSLPTTVPLPTMELIQKLAHGAPTLTDLDPEEAKKVAQAVLGDFLKDEMKRAVASQKIKFEVEVDLFIQDQGSSYTRKTYTFSLGVFRRWMKHRNLILLDLTPALADDYIRAQKGTGQDSDSVRLRVAAVSSFYTFLERRHPEVRNPFRGTKVRPRSSWAVATIPSPEEITLTKNSASPVTRAVISILAETGLRIGGLADLRVKADGNYHTWTKGKKFEGFWPLSKETRDAILEAGLPPSRPFLPQDQTVENVTGNLGARVFKHCKKLYQKGIIAAAYSPHDFRHAFAEAHLHLGLKRLRELLGHASISVTDKYLRNTLGTNTMQM